MATVLKAYYANYHGHTLADLKKVREYLVAHNYTSYIYFLGDSSLDNKAWIRDASVAPSRRMNGIVDKSVPDVCHWVNYYLDQQRNIQVNSYGNADIERTVCMNYAIEESTLYSRDWFLRDHDTEVSKDLTNDDYLVISVGGNDIALAPTPGIMLNMAIHACLPISVLDYNPSYYYFVSYYKSRIERMMKRVLDGKTPKHILLCGIYYPAVPGSSWADATLGFFSYSEHPIKLQTLIRRIFSAAIEKIIKDNPELKISYLPFYEVLDPNDAKDYVARVEPSTQGGAKMARAILEKLELIPKLEVHQEEAKND